MMRKHFSKFISLILIITLFNPIPYALGQSEEVDARLLQIREAIKDANARWRADENPISRLSEEDQRKLLGWIPSPESELYGDDTEVIDEGYGASLPTRFDWRDANGKSYITPVKRQRCGDCWAFAAIAALEGRLAINGTTGEDLSEQLLVSSCCDAGSCSGGYITSTSRFLTNTGSPDESCYPYLGRNSSCNQACKDWREIVRKTGGYVRVIQTVGALKNAVYTRGPLNVGMMVYSDFSSYSNGIYEHTSGTREGGHAVVIVGYEDDNQCFIVKNSWGKSWGENGYFRIAYSQVDNVVDFGAEACAYGDEIDHDDPEPDPDPDPDNELKNGDVVKDLSGSKGQWTNYTIQVPDGASDLKVAINDGDGDADLYVRVNAEPTTEDYDCRPNRWGNDEVCNSATPSPGVYHIGVYGYDDYSGLELSVTYVE